MKHRFSEDPSQVSEKKKIKSNKSSGSTIVSIAFRTSRPSELLTAFQHLQHRSQLHRQSCLQRNELLTGPVEEPWPFHHAGRFLTHSYLRKTPICSTVQWLYECNCNCQAWIHWILYHIQVIFRLISGSYLDWYSINGHFISYRII